MGVITERKVHVYFGEDADKASLPAATKSPGDLFIAVDTGKIYFWTDAGWVWPVPDGSIVAAKLAADAVETAKIKDANVTYAKLADDAKSKFGTKLLHVRDEKASGSTGGNSAVTTWNVRDLNTVKTNEITGASLAANQITLPAGTYYIMGRAPGFSVDRHQLRLRNITDVATALVGSSLFADNAGYVENSALIAGRFTIAAEKVFELQHYTQLAQVGTGLGVDASSGEIEVFADVHIWKVG